MNTIFLRVLDAEEKGSALLSVIRQGSKGIPKDWFAIPPSTFQNLPGSPFAYWLGPSVIAIFLNPAWQGAIRREAKNGMGTLNDFRFVRGAMELPSSSVALGSGWHGFSKGGRRASFYQDVSLYVRWHQQGAEVKAYVEQVYNGGHWSRSVRSVDYYFRPGITWPLRGIRFSAQAVPAGGIFSVGGKMLFADTPNLLLLLAILNSAAFDLLVTVFAGKVGGVQYQSGLIESIPIAAPEDRQLRARLEELARRAWSLKRDLDTRTETSHVFVLPALMRVAGNSIRERAVAWNTRVEEIGAEVATIEAEIDKHCFALYRIDQEDRRPITEGFARSNGTLELADESAEESEEPEDLDETAADTVVLAAELASWAVGVAFGRFDLRLATGDRPLPAEPEPFEPLSVCSPAMLTGQDGLPLAQPPAGYPLSFPEDGVLVDDPGHPRDLTAAVRTVFESVFGSRADAVWQEVAALLDPRDHDLRRWLSSGFFEHHLRRYAKSRRKAPIIWQLSIPSGRYSVWCYAHRMMRDSLFAVQNDIVGPKLTTEERRLSSLITQAGQTPSARERAEIAAQEIFVDELRTLLDEVGQVAGLWNSDFDDGIILVMAPLWRLVPTHKAWQKELRAKWDELVAGKFDWAHLAMHLWPERVILKCATDRSLAIAHGLEEVFWVEGNGGKWSAREKPTLPIDKLVSERTSPAVNAAVASILDAPGPVGGGKRRKKSRDAT